MSLEIINEIIGGAIALLLLGGGIAAFGLAMLGVYLREDRRG